MGWLWPVRLAGAAFALSWLIWFGLLGAYAALTPGGDCEGKGEGYQLMAWITFAVSGALFLALTFLAAGRLRINRLATMAITATLLLPLALFFALSLLIVNFTFCGD